MVFATEFQGPVIMYTPRLWSSHLLISNLSISGHVSLSLLRVFGEDCPSLSQLDIIVVRDEDLLHMQSTLPLLPTLHYDENYPGYTLSFTRVDTEVQISPGFSRVGHRFLQFQQAA